MGRRAVGLNELKIKNAKPKEKNYKLYDVDGLYLEVTKKGSKIWRVRYKFNGKEKTYTIGKYPVIGLRKAREENLKVKQLLADGVDPNVLKQKQKKSIEIEESKKLLKEAIEEFLDIKEKELAFPTYRHLESRLKHYVLPFLGDKKIDEIDKRDILELFEYMKTVPTPNTKKTDKTYTFRRTFNDLKRIFKFAMQRDYCDNNPCDKIDINSFFPRPQKKKMKALTDEKEVKQLYRLFYEYPSIVIGNALRFLALSVLRAGNIRDLRWDWIDWDKKIIVIPEERMKMRREFRLPLTDKMIEILEHMKKYTFEKSEYVFCSPLSVTKKMSENTLNFAHKRLGYDNHNAHGWRSSFSTICYEKMREHGFSSEVIELQLAHVVGNSVTRAYMRSDMLEERRKLLKWWGEFLEG